MSQKGSDLIRVVRARVNELTVKCAWLTTESELTKAEHDASAAFI